MQKPKSPKDVPKRPFPAHVTKVSAPSLTKQSFKDETNINNIMGQYSQTGQMPALNPVNPTYGYAPSYDFREALEIVENMTSNFDELPSQIRKKFGHNPVAFLEYMENPANEAEARALGLLPKTEAQASTDAQDVKNRATEALTTNTVDNSTPTTAEGNSGSSPT
nr:MAG: internal scaffolding protein [Microvirus sp.]